MNVTNEELERCMEVRGNFETWVTAALMVSSLRKTATMEIRFAYGTFDGFAYVDRRNDFFALSTWTTT